MIKTANLAGLLKAAFAPGGFGGLDIGTFTRSKHGFKPSQKQTDDASNFAHQTAQAGAGMVEGVKDTVLPSALAHPTKVKENLQGQADQLDDDFFRELQEYRTRTGASDEEMQQLYMKRMGASNPAELDRAERVRRKLNEGQVANSMGAEVIGAALPAGSAAKSVKALGTVGRAAKVAPKVTSTVGRSVTQIPPRVPEQGMLGKIWEAGKLGTWVDKGGQLLSRKGGRLAPLGEHVSTAGKAMNMAGDLAFKGDMAARGVSGIRGGIEGYSTSADEPMPTSERWARTLVGAGQGHEDYVNGKGGLMNTVMQFNPNMWVQGAMHGFPMLADKVVSPEARAYAKAHPEQVVNAGLQAFNTAGNAASTGAGAAKVGAQSFDGFGNAGQLQNYLINLQKDPKLKPYADAALQKLGQGDIAGAKEQATHLGFATGEKVVGDAYESGNLGDLASRTWSGVKGAWGAAQQGASGTPAEGAPADTRVAAGPAIPPQVSKVLNDPRNQEALGNTIDSVAGGDWKGALENGNTLATTAGRNMASDAIADGTAEQLARTGIQKARDAWAARNNSVGQAGDSSAVAGMYASGNGYRLNYGETAGDNSRSVASQPVAAQPGQGGQQPAAVPANTPVEAPQIARQGGTPYNYTGASGLTMGMDADISHSDYGQLPSWNASIAQQPAQEQQVAQQAPQQYAPQQSQTPQLAHVSQRQAAPQQASPLGMDAWKKQQASKLRQAGYGRAQIDTMLTNQAYRNSNGGRNDVDTTGYRTKSQLAGNRRGYGTGSRNNGLASL